MTMTQTSEMVRAGTERHDGLGGSLARTGETASAAVAAQAEAMVKAKYIMAMQNPRDVELARVELLAACRRPIFAEEAIWSKPQGGKTLEGPSIRLVEEAVRAFGNVDVETVVKFEDAEKRIFKVSVTDLQKNTGFSADVTVEKTVERSKAEGREVVGRRKNTWNKDVYIVIATEDEMGAKAGSALSKAIRVNGIRVLPSYLIQEAQQVCRQTMASEDKKDPDAANKRVIDAFASIGVKPDALKSYLGHDVASCSPVEREELRGLYAAIKEGGTSWKDALDAKTGVTEDKKPTEAGTVAERVKAKAQAARTVVEAPADPPSEKRERQPGEEG